jgi:hypothetical protein
MSERSRHTVAERCSALLDWAEKNPNMKTSITDISNATGIPRMTLHWILSDDEIRPETSVLNRVANSEGYEYSIDTTWNKIHKYDRKKHIIHAAKK